MVRLLKELRDEPSIWSKVDLAGGSAHGSRWRHLPGCAPHRRARAPVHGAGDQSPAHRVYRGLARVARAPLDGVARARGLDDLTGRKSRSPGGTDSFTVDDHR